MVDEMKRIETILIIYPRPRMFLGFKNPKKKFGGKWNGFGGGLEEGQSLEECAIKETYDETGLVVKDLKKRGIIRFYFEDGEEHEVHIYITDNYKGEPNTLKDFVKYKYFHENEISKVYNDMMPADRYWIPFLISGKLFTGRVYFTKKSGKLEVKDYNLNAVRNLN